MRSLDSQQLKSRLSRIPRLSPQLLVRLGLGLVLVVALWFLLRGPNPWDAGKLKKLDLLIRDWSWYAAAVNACLLVILLVSSRWWLRALRARADLQARSPLSGWFWIGLGGILLVALLLRLPRLDLSLYSDEMYTLERFVHGHWKNDGTWTAVAWKKTFWFYPRPNNHVLSSLLTRFSHQIWCSVAGLPQETIVESAWRLPGLLASVASLAVLALALARNGFVRAGLLAPALLAIHPWHVAHSVEVRGYPLVFLFSAWLVFALLNVVRSGAWRSVISAALASFCLLYTYPGALFCVVAACAAAAIYAWVRHGRGAWVVVVRLLVAHALALMVVLQLLAPCIPQLREYLDSTALASQDVAGKSWEMVSRLSTGMSWVAWEETNPEMVTAGEQSIAVVWLDLLAVLIVCGSWALRRSPLLALALVFLIVPCLGFIQALATGTYVFVWYVVYATPFLFVLAAASVELLPPARLRLGTNSEGGEVQLGQVGARVRLVLPLVASVLVFGLFLSVTIKQCRVIRRVSKEPLREAARSLLASLEDEPGARGTIVWPNAQYYAPKIPVSMDGADLREQIAQADEAGVSLYVVYGYRVALRDRRDTHEVVSNRELFETVQVFPGLDSGNSSYYLLRYEPENAELE